VTRSSDKASGAVSASQEDAQVTGVVDWQGSDTPASVLVVDDEQLVCRFLESVLLSSGYQVQTCLSGQEAITRLREGAFQVVITDLRMPGVDGVTVLAKAKELDPLCQVIVITAYGSMESAVEAMKLGAYDYINKPFNIDEIRILIDKALEKRTLLRAAQERDFYRDLSRMNGLTEVYNYRAFYELLGAEIARSTRHDRPMTLLMIDLDDLKAYNDALGHPAGDALLKQAAWLLKKSVRNCDIVARYGGDEFAIILVETSKATALDTAERVRRLMEETRFEHDDILPHKTLTVSVGVAGYPTDAEKKMDLVSKADRALYEAKTLGGNQVMGATG
jgi:two-component system cell cycle response regulator